MSIGRTRRSSQSGPSVRSVPAKRSTRTAVIFMPARSVLRRQRGRRAELRLVDHPLVAIAGMLDAVVEVAPLDRQQTLNGIRAGRHVPFQSIGDEIDRLSDLELVMCHVASRGIRRRTDTAEPRKSTGQPDTFGADRRLYR